MNDYHEKYIREYIDTSEIEVKLPLRLTIMIEKLRQAAKNDDQKAWESAKNNLALYLKVYYNDNTNLTFDEWKTLHDKYRLQIYLD